MTGSPEVEPLIALLEAGPDGAEFSTAGLEAFKQRAVASSKQQRRELAEKLVTLALELEQRSELDTTVARAQLVYFVAELFGSWRQASALFRRAA